MLGSLVRRSVVVLAAMGLVVVHAPSAGASTEAGAAFGNLVVAPTLVVNGCAATAVNLIGAFAVGGFVDGKFDLATASVAADGAAGVININAAGGSPCESVAGGFGVLNVLWCGNVLGASTGTGKPTVLAAVNGCALAGNYNRVGTVVIVNLAGNVVLGTGTVVPISINVVGLLVPTNNGALTGTPQNAVLGGVVAGTTVSF
jgi:hypothetical protein